MEWTKDLSVGVELIDEQHRELFKRINDLVNSIKKSECKLTIGGTLQFLDEYAREHFGAEEKLMQEYGYAAFEYHKAQHSLFLQSLQDLKRMSEGPEVKGSNYELSVTTNQVVVDWIIDHIMKIDRKLGDFLREKGN